MRKTKIKTKSNFIKLVLAAAIFALLLFDFAKIEASSFSDCDQLQGVDKEKCIALEKQAETYQAVINLKSEQQTSIKNQIQNINSQQNQNDTDLQQIKNQLDDLNQQISDLEDQIQAKEQSISSYKYILSGLMQTYYEYNQGIMEVVLADKNFSDVLGQADYSQQLGLRINEVLASVKSAKADLENNQQQLNQKQDESESIKRELESKGINLQDNEIQNQTLLTQVQTDQTRYQELLSNVEAQKAELFNVGGASNITAVLANVNKYLKPKDHLASTNWYFSQWDSRWGNDPIGGSKYLMKDYGCAVTAVSMVFRKYGASINPGKMANEPIFSGALIEWPDSWSSGISLVLNSGHSGVDWNKVDDALSHNELVIVYIRKTNSSGGHYVVITGQDKTGYIVHDPYFGPNLYLSTSRALVGQLSPSGDTSVDQMIIYK